MHVAISYLKSFLILPWLPSFSYSHHLFSLYLTTVPLLLSCLALCCPLTSPSLIHTRLLSCSDQSLYITLTTIHILISSFFPHLLSLLPHSNMYYSSSLFLTSYSQYFSSPTLTMFSLLLKLLWWLSLFYFHHSPFLTLTSLPLITLPLIFLIFHLSFLHCYNCRSYYYYCDLYYCYNSC